MESESKRLTPNGQAERLLEGADVPGVVNVMIGDGYSLWEIACGMRMCGYNVNFVRDDKLKLTTIVISEKPIIDMLADVGRSAFDATRHSKAYPQEVAIGDLRESLGYLLENWEDIEFPTGYCFTRHEK